MASQMAQNRSKQYMIKDETVLNSDTNKTYTQKSED